MQVIQPCTKPSAERQSCPAEIVRRAMGNLKGVKRRSGHCISPPILGKVAISGPVNWDYTDRVGGIVYRTLGQLWRFSFHIWVIETSNFQSYY